MPVQFLNRKISIENVTHCGAFLAWFEEMHLGLVWIA
jgi:hypothetical protein